MKVGVGRRVKFWEHVLCDNVWLRDAHTYIFPLAAPLQKVCGILWFTRMYRYVLGVKRITAILGNSMR